MAILRRYTNVSNAGNIVNFDGANATDSCNFKAKNSCQTNDDGIINVEIMVPLKYLSNFWRTLEIPLINCEVELILMWSAGCVIIYTNVANQNSIVLAFENDAHIVYILIVQ